MLACVFVGWIASVFFVVFGGGVWRFLVLICFSCFFLELLRIAKAVIAPKIVINPMTINNGCVIRLPNGSKGTETVTLSDTRGVIEIVPMFVVAMSCSNRKRLIDKLMVVSS